MNLQVPEAQIPLRESSSISEILVKKIVKKYLVTLIERYLGNIKESENNVVMDSRLFTKLLYHSVEIRWEKETMKGPNANGHVPEIKQQRKYLEKMGQE